MNDRPKIPADAFFIVCGSSGVVLLVQQAQFPNAPQEGENQAVPLAVVAEIRISPFIAKQLLQGLAVNLHKYEAAFGEIVLPPPAGKPN